MTKVGAILGAILIIQIVYPFLAALYIYRHVRGRKTYKRYCGQHVYVTIADSDYHVPREVLELFMHIDDPRIEPADAGSEPNNPRVFFCWGLALLLPRIVGRAIRPFDDAANKR